MTILLTPGIAKRRFFTCQLTIRHTSIFGVVSEVNAYLTVHPKGELTGRTSGLATPHVTLLGDAAHPMTPDMNQGAGQTIEDAIILASLLERNFSLQEALSRYEHLRIPRTSKIVKQSRQSGEIEHIRNPLLCSLRNTMYALTPSELLIKQMVIVSRFELT
jgi:2-polyprenyl-6-methoxyphenol hydroxylase-like FAD-dependent oxidoreductase